MIFAMEIKVGQKSKFSRSFTREDVISFGELSGDKGIHHVQPDNLGRIMVQGLLTATIPTKMGGDLNFIARDFSFHFIKPVYVGDLISCDSEITKVNKEEKVMRLRISMNGFNQNNEQVFAGQVDGIIRL